VRLYLRDLIAVTGYFDCRFAIPLLSVAGQRLVLNLRSLKAQTYTTDDLNRVVDRQLEAFAGPSIAVDDMSDRELGRETTGNVN